MPNQATTVTDLPKKPQFDKKQIAIGAGLALTGVAAVVVLRSKLNGTLPVEAAVKVDTAKKAS